MVGGGLASDMWGPHLAGSPLPVRIGRFRKSVLAKTAGALLLRYMLGWSMNLFRVRGIQLAVHFSFFLLLGFTAWNGWTDDRAAGVFWYTLVLLTCFACVILHELGHSLTAIHFGIGVRRILLLPIGGMAEFDSIPREPRREILITLAGPAVNFVLAGLLWIALPPAPAQESAHLNPLEFGHLLLFWNLLMGGFNLLPAFPMDGGRILRALLALRCSYLKATFWAATVGKGVALLGFGAAFYFEQPMLGLLFGFIVLVGELEYRAVKRRAGEEAQLRALCGDVMGFPPVSDEPPVLRG
jgi:Zn-dependent protease